MALLKLNRIRRSVMIGALVISSPVLAIETSTLVQSALSEDCIEYQVVGICFWLRCTNFGCDVETSVKVRHFIPETVVSSYSVTGQNPWTEVASYSGPTGTAQDGGNSTTNHKRENEMRHLQKRRCHRSPRHSAQRVTRSQLGTSAIAQQSPTFPIS